MVLQIFCFCIVVIMLCMIAGKISQMVVQILLNFNTTLVTSSSGVVSTSHLLFHRHLSTSNLCRLHETMSASFLQAMTPRCRPQQQAQAMGCPFDQDCLHVTILVQMIQVVPLEENTSISGIFSHCFKCIMQLEHLERRSPTRQLIASILPGYAIWESQPFGDAPSPPNIHRLSSYSKQQTDRETNKQTLRKNIVFLFKKITQSHLNLKRLFGGLKHVCYRMRCSNILPEVFGVALHLNCTSGSLQYKSKDMLVSVLSPCQLKPTHMVYEIV